MSILGGEDAPIVVITGPTGAGKSTLCGWLAQRGAFVIEADRVGHELLLEDPVRQRLQESFGDEIFDGVGGIDRKKLGRLVFSNAGDLAKLNSIVHPALVAELERRIERLRSGRGATLIVIDAALYFQFEPRLVCDLVVGVSVDAQTLKNRIMQRDGLSELEADQRLARQEDVRSSVDGAELILDGTLPQDDLRQQLFEQLDERLATRLCVSDPAARRAEPD